MIDPRTPEEILYSAVSTIANVGEDIPDNATHSYIALMWGAMVRCAERAKAKVDERRAR